MFYSRAHITLAGNVVFDEECYEKTMRKNRCLKCYEKAMEIWFFLHINIIQDSFENRSKGWYARKSLSVWKSYEIAKGNPMATTDAGKEKTCADQIGFG